MDQTGTNPPVGGDGSEGVEAHQEGRYEASNILVAAVAHHGLYVAALHVEPEAMNDLNARDTDPLTAAITFHGFGNEEFKVPHPRAN